MDWDKLKTFYYVAKLGSFTNAAQFLNISQSAISRQISELEKRVCLKLFERHVRGLVLTQMGEILFRTACKIFEEIQAAENLIKGGSEEPQGTLKIASSSGFIAALLLTDINNFFEQYPKLNIQIKLMDNQPDLAFREADIAILPQMSSNPNVVQNYLMRFNLKLYASKGYLKKHGEPKSLEDLVNHRLITYDKEGSLFSEAMSWHLKAGMPEYHALAPKLMINSALSLYYAIKAGAGIVTLAAENPVTQDPEIINILPELTGNSIDAYFIYPQFLQESAAIKAFENFLRDVIKRNGWQ